MICPIKQAAAIIANQGKNLSLLTNKETIDSMINAISCIKSDCAWRADGQCAIVKNTKEK